MLNSLLSLLLSLSTLLSAAEFMTEKGAFILDGKPFQIRSGEIHYSRVPRAEWRSRIHMAKTMGLNTISTYVFWNYHETQAGEFDFNGEKDVMEFVRLCGAEGMKVIVRPGPYVCAEWDLGGLPAWLLKEPGIKLRSSDGWFLEPAKIWMRRMGSMLKPLAVSRGGPVIMVQVENEFGSYGAPDSGYLDAMQAALRGGGWDGVVFSSDAPGVQNGGRPGMLHAANFGKKAEKMIKGHREVFPGQPDFCAEFWVGWFDTWGRSRSGGMDFRMTEDLGWMMRNGVSFNLYMFHGGSTRGLWTGANGGKRYLPTTCSYDYTAPLDESGRPNLKFDAIRSVIRQSLSGETLPSVPKLPSPGSVGDFTFTEHFRLLHSLPEGKASATLKTMEDFGQTTGMMLYRTRLEGPVEGELKLGEVKDRVHVILDGQVVGVSGRSTDVASVPLKAGAGTHKLDLLVENMGRINYGKLMNEERKGLSSPVILAGHELGPFEHVCLPMQDAPVAKAESSTDEEANGPLTVHRCKVKFDNPRDTWLDMRGFGRGIVWFNGHNLGRYWNVGPTYSVFLPACWMKANEENELVVLTLESAHCPDKVSTSPEAILKE